MKYVSFKWQSSSWPIPLDVFLPVVIKLGSAAVESIRWGPEKGRALAPSLGWFSWLQHADILIPLPVYARKI